MSKSSWTNTFDSFWDNSFWHTEQSPTDVEIDAEELQHLDDSEGKVYEHAYWERRAQDTPGEREEHE